MILATAQLGVGGSAADAAVDPTAYSATITVTAGENVASQVPVTLDMPAPGDGVAVAKVTFSWSRPSPTIGRAQTTSLTMLTPECVADQPCQVTRSLSTSRMANGTPSVIVRVSDDTQVIGTKTITLTVDNPKPTAAFTSPVDYSTVWGDVTLAADAAPGDGGAPLAGVRFYTKATSQETDPYVFDDTAPYSVQVPATDISDSGGGGYVYAVAEDAEGNLTPMDPLSDTRTPSRRYVTVGPPANLQFVSPAEDDRAIGSTVSADGSADYAPQLSWHAEVPDGVAGNPLPRYITRVEVFVDGVLWRDMPYDVDSWYSTAKPQAVDWGWWWQPAGGPAPGPHTALLRVTTSYGSVAETTRRFIVNDGVTFSPVLDAGRTVSNGYVVTAGTVHRLSVTARGKVQHAELQNWDMRDQYGSHVDGPRACTVTDPGICPDQVTIAGDWMAPTRGGRYTLTWEVRPRADVTATMTRTIVVQARGALSASTSTPVVRAGRRATVAGRFTRTDTGAGVAGVGVQLQWRKAGTTTWSAIGTIVTDAYGRVAAHPLRRTTGAYRWVTSGRPGTVTSAYSAQVGVRVRR